MHIIFLIIFFILSCTPTKLEIDHSGSFYFKNNINKIIESSNLNANIAIEIRSLNNGRTLYSLNRNRLLTPASNIKLITSSAALEYLGDKFKLVESFLYSYQHPYNRNRRKYIYSLYKRINK